MKMISTVVVPCLCRNPHLLPPQRWHEEQEQINVEVLCEKRSDAIPLVRVRLNVIEDALIMRSALLDSVKKLCRVRDFFEERGECSRHAKRPNNYLALDCAAYLVS
jgi:hypothetical protein